MRPAVQYDTLRPYAKIKISSVSPVSMMNRGAVAECAGAECALRAIFLF